MATAGKNLSVYDKSNLPNGAHFRVGIVVSKWNAEITHALRDGALEVLFAAGVPPENCIVHEVPGAFELPLATKWMLDSSPSVDAVIAIGSVIRGETAHFDYVCQGATQGIQEVNLKYNKPVMFCVLTDDTIKQSKARSGGKLGNKGVEAAVGALKMLGLTEKLG